MAAEWFGGEVVAEEEDVGGGEDIADPDSEEPAAFEARVGEEDIVDK
jgi:hypothetical protein